jgi:hypothetical protein
MVVWSDSNSDEFILIYEKDMILFDWEHTWAAQYSPDDTKLMLAGVISPVHGELAIFTTGTEN